MESIVWEEPFPLQQCSHGDYFLGAHTVLKGITSYHQLKLTMSDSLHVKRQDDSTCYLGSVQKVSSTAG